MSHHMASKLCLVRNLCGCLKSWNSRRLSVQCTRRLSSSPALASLPEQIRQELHSLLAASQFPSDSAEFVRRLWAHFDANAAKSTACRDTEANQQGAVTIDQQPPFVLMLPPPNVTGVLHMGHALAFVIQDVLVRWHRLRGRRAVWTPGFDHAGIATQVLMERRLRQELGLTRYQIGRERFIAEAGKWAHQKRSEIKRQMELLGLSVDWHEEYFTYDEKHSKAVTEAFVRLFDQGLVHRSEQLVNWSCALGSAISDIEVETQEIPGPTRISVPGHPRPVEFGRLHRFEYPLADAVSGDGVTGVVVATTRPETMLGDTAVAVHPSDARFARLVGRRLRHPLAVDAADGRPRLLPVVAHTDVDPQFGTGAVKLTPGHSRADFAIAGQLTRGLVPLLRVFTETGLVADGCGAPADLVGLPRFAAREAVIAKLTELGLYRGSEEHSMTLPLCSRSGDVVEQMLKSQWFVRCSGGMANRAADAVSSGRLRIQPAGYAADWLEWMRRVGDWCVSRQIWWGHQVPAYEVIAVADGRSLGWVAGRTEAEATSRAAEQFGGGGGGGICLRRDPDVLDTWFSSGLLPLSLAGWPDRGDPDPARLPLSLLETGHDILFFWAARMAMLTEQLCGRLPFHRVLLNGLMCDPKGRKMSKSQGNVLDPIEMIGRSGPDALRLALCSHRFQLERVAFDPQLVEVSARLINKLWQAHRFLRPRLAAAGLLGRGSDAALLMADIEASEDELDMMDRWLMSRLAALVDDCERSLHPDSLQLQEAANRLREFWISDFCDVGLECLKSPAAGAASLRVACLASALFLRLLNPFCPHACELLWLGAHADANFSGGPLAAAGGGFWTEGDQRRLLERWRSRGKEEVAGMVRDLLVRCLDWRALLRPSRPGACFLLYNSARCPIDATLYSRLISQVGHLHIQTAGSSQGPSQLLRLELCDGLHFAVPRDAVRIDAAVKDLEARRQKQAEKRDQLLLLLTQTDRQGPRVAAAAGGAESSGTVSPPAVTEAQRKKLASLTEQVDLLTNRLEQLDDSGSQRNWNW